MTEDKAAQNFLATMDMRLPMIDHLRNARRDAISYKWKPSTLSAINHGIQKAYMQKIKIKE